MPSAPDGRGWAIKRDDDVAVIVMSGDWIARVCGVDTLAASSIVASGARTIRFDSTGLGRWDSALIAFVLALRDAARGGAVAVDESGLPDPARKLLALTMEPGAAPAARPGGALLDRLGLWGIGVYVEAVEVSALVGMACLRGGVALRGRSSMRVADLVACLHDAGGAALAIVAIVNVLVGGILAFVGAVQLGRFGADVYVPSLVGISVVREMAALMTAIVMAGRTGGAYAAHIATMQGDEEIDALRAFGIPVFDYIVLPRVVALTAMMPILYLYGCAFGIFGGFVVAVTTLNHSPISYVEATRLAVTGNQFGLGLSKSLCFGALIAIAGCRVGLRAGRTAADVGRAATSAVVVGIVGIIALDAVFSLCARALGL